MPAIEDQNVTIEEFFDNLTSYLDEKQIAFVKKAYDFAARMHADQKRRSGEPYIIHPTQVANILAQMKMDEETLAARVRALVANNSDVAVYVAADGAGAYQNVMDAMVLLQRAGVERVGLMSNPRQDGAP